MSQYPQLIYTNPAGVYVLLREHKDFARDTWDTIVKVHISSASMSISLQLAEHGHAIVHWTSSFSYLFHRCFALSLKYKTCLYLEWYCATSVETVVASDKHKIWNGVSTPFIQHQ